MTDNPARKGIPKTSNSEPIRDAVTAVAIHSGYERNSMIVYSTASGAACPCCGARSPVTCTKKRNKSIIRYHRCPTPSCLKTFQSIEKTDIFSDDTKTRIRSLLRELETLLNL